jgi:small subunit ribosomal protein S13
VTSLETVLNLESCGSFQSLHELSDSSPIFCLIRRKIVARIAGVDLPRNKRIDIGLTYIYGIGHHTASKLVDDLEIDPTKKTDDLTEDEITRLRGQITQECKVEGDLRREIDLNVKRLMDINSYRGFRHRRQLPVRGQRTSTNARTRKGKAKTISVGRKAQEAARRGG